MAKNSGDAHRLRRRGGFQTLPRYTTTLIYGDGLRAIPLVMFTLLELAVALTVPEYPLYRHSLESHAQPA
jgi:hypothetical protein